MNALVTYVSNVIRREEGQDLLEYALLIALIALVAIVGVTSAGQQVNTIFGNITSAL
jgi:pilus assembly protein Flp/PilA